MNHKFALAHWIARGIGVLALYAAAAPGCIYDASARCGDGQDFDGTRCVCKAGLGLVGKQCVQCGEHEIGSADGCACAPGYVELTAGGPCQADPALGKACTSNADCTEARYPYCRVESTGGYCTASGCSSDADCVGDWSCTTQQTPSFCQQPPSGLGTPCTSSADCAGFTASYCEAVMAHECLVNGCKADPNKCHGDWVCCDISLLSQSLCVPPSELSNGTCPGGGTLIPRGG